VGDKKFSVLGAYVAVTAVLAGGPAFAHSHKHQHRAVATSARASRHHHTQFTRISYRHLHKYHQYAYGAHVIQCVAFAKQDAGIMIRGNARDWWARAAGIYERGSRPEEGSVLSFRSIGRMPLGHVAVVSGIEDSRTIVIDQSHWNSRGITRDMEVKDVSENNDWTAVRVQLSHGGAFGSIYPTHGFIYPRPAKGGEVVAADDREEATVRVQPIRTSLEVAEMPASGKPLDLTMPGISFDAPNRALQ